MRTQKLYCEVCGKETEHKIDSDEDEGEMALCTSCGRLVSLPPCAGANVQPGGQDPCRR